MFWGLLPGVYPPVIGPGRSTRILLALTSAALAGLVAASTAAAGDRAVVDHVADGDTLKVEIGGREEYVRLIGIDTPEVYEGTECGGPHASRSMKRMVKPGDRVKLIRDRSQDNRDTYDRLLRYVELDGHDLGRAQVSKGWARVYVFDQPYRRLDDYDRAEDRASKQDRGVWGECGGF
jgi:endonuclease YncB( thermonuclease family)